MTSGGIQRVVREKQVITALHYCRIFLLNI